MTYQLKIGLAISLVFSSAAMTAARQLPSKAPATGIPACNKYDAMVTACLPKMCEADRAVAELDLAFHREVLPKEIQHNGRDAAARTCVEKTNEAIKDDVFGCYAGTGGVTGRPAPLIRVDGVRAADTSVVMTLTSIGPTSPVGAEVIILTDIGEPPAVVYRLPEWKGQFVLDTAAASPARTAKASAPNPPMRLEPGTSYCFVVGASTDTVTDVYRKGMFTTRPKR